MTRITLVLAILLATGLSAPLAAQPTDGDLVVTFGPLGPGGNGFTAYMRPGGSGGLTTIAAGASDTADVWVRMAPNNQDLVITQSTVTSWIPLAGYSHLVRLQPNGTATTITTSLAHSIDGFELDHDNQWVAAARDPFFSKTYLLGIDDTTGAVTTFANLPAPTVSGVIGGFNEVAIDRDPGAPTYAAVWHPLTANLSAKIVGVDRQGSVTTIAATAGQSLQVGEAIELHPRSGDYVHANESRGPGEPVFDRVTKGGVITSLNINAATFTLAHSARIGQDDTVWIVYGGGQGMVTSVVHYDFRTNAVIATRTVGKPLGTITSALEVYGARPLTCNGTGKPGTTVKVSIRSQRPAAANARYALAASFARRPGVQLANGEWLDLAQDALFLLSAQNLAPSTFQNFRGTLNPFGAAGATVNIPASLPSGLGIAVFVAGVIYNNQGIVQVTPSHWVVLS